MWAYIAMVAFLTLVLIGYLYVQVTEPNYCWCGCDRCCMEVEA